MVNKAIVVGHLGADPEIRRTQDGRPIATFSVATSERWRDKTTGERKEHTDWHRVVVFSEPLAKVCEQYLKKGAKVYVEGAMKTRKWTDQGGVDRYVTEIVLQGFHSSLQMLDKVGNGGVPKPEDESQYGSGAARSTASPPGREAAPDMDDEIPF